MYLDKIKNAVTVRVCVCMCGYIMSLLSQQIQWLYNTGRTTSPSACVQTDNKFHVLRQILQPAHTTDTDFKYKTTFHC